MPGVVQEKLYSFFADKQLVIHPGEASGTLADAIVIGRGNILTPDGIAIIRDVSASMNVGPLEHYLLGSDFNEPSYLAKDIACVATLGGNSYYHWLIEEVPRIISFVTNGGNCLYLSCEMDQPLHQLLTWLGYSGELLKASDNVIFRARSVQCQVLHGQSGTPSSRILASVHKLRRVITASDAKVLSPHKRIYIARRSTRKLLNEDYILNNILEPLGFHVVDLDRMPWKDQINLFTNADIVIGAHGAAFSNIIFMKEGSCVIELFGVSYVHWCFWHLSQHLKLNYYACVESSSVEPFHGPNDGYRSFKIDPADLVNIINLLNL